MPVRFKTSSEYDRNFKWRTSHDANEDPSDMSRWAGLRSEELGITKEPGFPSKRRVPYYYPQISKSFQWKENDDYVKESVKLDGGIEKDSLVKEKIITPDAPRLKKKARSKSAVPRIETDNGHSAAPRMQSPEGHSEVVRTQPAKGSSPVAGIRNNKEDYKKAPVPKISIHHKEANGVHRVLQKKAGMNVEPSHHPLRTSEYQRQFERKTGTENSPLLAAEQVVHNKNHSVPPFKLNNPNIETEYNSQFKGSPPSKGPKLRKDWEDKHHTEYDTNHHSPKRKDKKKTVGEVKSGSAKVNTSDIEQKATDQINILKENVIKQLYTPTKYNRKAKTEYSANYLSPSDYKYKDGAWMRAKPQVNDQDSPLSVGSMWVAEVKELREKAEYYRRRAQGTHFSRDHLNQIMSTDNKFWDVSSTSSGEEDMSNNIKALDLAGLHSSSRNESKHQSPTKPKAASNTGILGVSDVPTLTVRRKLVWDEYEDTEKNEDVTPLGTDDEAEEVADAEDRVEVEENDEKFHEDNNKTRPYGKKSSLLEDESERTSVTSGVEGRLPTPKLKTLGLVQRTHHDLTTPATGGALLVSPSKNQQHTPEHSQKRSSKKHGSPKKTVSKAVNERNGKRDDQQAAQSPPVAGLKTVDPLPIREDPWTSLSNKPLPATIAYPVCRSVENPYVPLPWQWSPLCRIQGTLRDPEFQHNGNFNSIGIYGSAVNDDDSNEDDRLSQISARSAASSSLASQVLERAQKRKENFWGNK
ncbi:PREDICTED: nuclear protein MDM1 [Nanorana parkeri]|uniref:nuclear protein MDM1 n=1 Tax=Nanorana parkeri TaxID=125878 RepID=UPI000854E30E|nr:PREDICTED: nuclear protein MDM1 [Nanorana parkeri]